MSKGNKGGGGGGNKPAATGWNASITATPELVNSDGKSIGQVAAEATIVGLVGVLGAVTMKVISGTIYRLLGADTKQEETVPKHVFQKQLERVNALQKELAAAKSSKSDDSDDDDSDD